MDILAARKKAAEQARKKNEAAAAQPPVPKPKEEEALPPVVERPAEAPLSASPEPAVPAEAAAGPPVSGAAEPAETPESQREIELLSFRMGAEAYAIPVEHVREVLKLYQLTAVPNAPEHVLGVMSLRGEVIPVVDLCKRLALASGVKGEKSRIIVVSIDDEDVGLMVDGVTGVLRIMPGDIKRPPDNIEHGAELLLGIARKGDKLYILLDLAKTLA